MQIAAYRFTTNDSSLAVQPFWEATVAARRGRHVKSTECPGYLRRNRLRKRS